MKFTIGKLTDICKALHSMLNKPMKASLAFRLSRFFQIANQELQPAEIQRIKLLDRLGIKSDTPDVYTIPPQNVSQFNSELQSLLSVEVDISFQPISIEEFGDMDISLAEANGIQPLLKETT